jgi:hypothetical protein
MKIGIFILAFFTCIATLFAQDEKATWQASPISIDGASSDWGANLRFFNSEAKLHFEYRNDGRNLYLILMTSEKSTMMQMMKAGCSVNLKAKKSLSTNATITIPAHRFEITQSNWDKSGGLTDKLVEKSATKPGVFKDTVVLEGFKFSEGIITDDYKLENRFFFAKNKGRQAQLIYEFCVPLCELFGEKYSLNTISLLPFQFEVILNELSFSDGEKSSRRDGNRTEKVMSQSGGMHRGGGMRGGGAMHGGGMNGDQELGDRIQSEHGEMHGESSMNKKKITNVFYFSIGK